MCSSDLIYLLLENFTTLWSNDAHVVIVVAVAILSNFVKKERAILYCTCNNLLTLQRLPASRQICDIDLLSSLPRSEFMLRTLAVSFKESSSESYAFFLDDRCPAIFKIN